MALTAQTFLPAQAAAGAAVATLLGVATDIAGTGNAVQRVTLVPPSGYTTVTGVATNNVTFALRQWRAGALIATVGTVTLTAGNNLVANTPLALTVTAGSLTAGDVLDVLMTQNGTGLAVGAGVLAVAESNFTSR